MNVESILDNVENIEKFASSFRRTLAPIYGEAPVLVVVVVVVQSQICVVVVVFPGMARQGKKAAGR